MTFEKRIRVTVKNEIDLNYNLSRDSRSYRKYILVQCKLIIRNIGLVPSHLSVHFVHLYINIAGDSLPLPKM